MIQNKTDFMSNPIQEFKTQVTSLQEVDIGDFRRRLSLYISRLEEKLPYKQPITTVIEKMKHTVLYEPHQSSEDIRKSILQKISDLAQLL